MPFLPQAINSVLDQTYDDFELIVIDDGSTDETEIYLDTISDPKLRVIRTDGIGISAALNLGIAESDSEFIARMDADDICERNRLEQQLVCLEHNPSVVVCGTQAKLIDEDGIEIGDRFFPCSDAAIKFQLLFQCPFLHPSVVIRRNALLSAGGYADVDISEDLELWCRIASYGNFINLNFPYLKYRIHAKSITMTSNDKQTENSYYHQSKYAQSLDNALCQESFKQLFWILKNYKIENDTPLRSVLQQYSRLKNSFPAKSSDPELKKELKRFNKKMRLILGNAAKTNFLHPVRFSKFLVARALTG